jgi:soluble lytic murein transglycosylase
LKKLGQNRQWQTFLTHYDGSSNSELNCYYLRALYGTSQVEQALGLTAPAWVQADSQPKACDPLFEVWRRSEHFTEEIVWQRLKIALEANEVTVASYLLRYFQDQTLADLFYKSHISPKRVLVHSQYSGDTVKHREIISHGLIRLANKDPEAAVAAWPTYQRTHQFDATQAAQLEQQLLSKLPRAEVFPSPKQRSKVVDTRFILTLKDEAVKQQRWDEVIHWSQQLPTDILNQPENQYWLARALSISTGDGERAQLAYGSLARTRHYYGFWAAHHIGIPGQLTANPIYDQRSAITRLKNQPRFARSMELFAIGDELNGRREWFAGLKESATHDQKIAAELALANGLVTLAIQTANHANARNSLHLRFPTAYLAQLRRASLDTDLPVPTLIAMARQESALNRAASSSANARGLMQLLPSTARLVARRHHLRIPKIEDLFDPQTNINLGSRHLAWLVERYDGQLVPAIAAYNAGEHRVDRWLRANDQLPLDVWIETIPFRETRNYVKNVLAFRHVYAQLTRSPLPFIDRTQMVVKKR